MLYNIINTVYYIKLNYIILYITLLCDHRRICGPSLTETSLCGAYPYLYNFTGKALTQCTVECLLDRASL